MFEETEVEIDSMIELVRTCQGLRFNGLYINAVSSTGVEFSEAVHNKESAREVVADLQKAVGPCYSKIEVWNATCTEQVNLD